MRGQGRPETTRTRERGDLHGETEQRAGCRGPPLAARTEEGNQQRAEERAGVGGVLEGGHLHVFTDACEGSVWSVLEESEPLRVSPRRLLTQKELGSQRHTWARAPPARGLQTRTRRPHAPGRTGEGGRWATRRPAEPSVAQRATRNACGKDDNSLAARKLKTSAGVNNWPGGEINTRVVLGQLGQRAAPHVRAETGEGRAAGP